MNAVLARAALTAMTAARLAPVIVAGREPAGTIALPQKGHDSSARACRWHEGQGIKLMR